MACVDSLICVVSCGFHLRTRRKDWISSVELERDGVLWAGDSRSDGARLAGQSAIESEVPIVDGTEIARSSNELEGCKSEVDVVFCDRVLLDGSSLREEVSQN